MRIRLDLARFESTPEGTNCIRRRRSFATTEKASSARRTQLPLWPAAMLPANYPLGSWSPILKSCGYLPTQTPVSTYVYVGRPERPPCHLIDIWPEQPSLGHPIHPAAGRRKASGGSRPTRRSDESQVPVKRSGGDYPTTAGHNGHLAEREL